MGRGVFFACKRVFVLKMLLKLRMARGLEYVRLSLFLVLAEISSSSIKILEPPAVARNELSLNSVRNTVTLFALTPKRLLEKDHLSPKAAKPRNRIYPNILCKFINKAGTHSFPRLLGILRLDRS